MRKLRLLLIEGDADVRHSITTVLSGRFGDNSVEAVDSLSPALTLPLHDFDLVLTDWRLADANGPVVLEKLRSGGAHAIIVVTEANVGAVAAEAVLCGAVDYVVRHRDYLSTLPLVIEKNLAVDRLRRERDMLHQRLIEQNDRMELLLKSLEEAAATDPLTGLYNRRHFSRILDQFFADAMRGGTDLSCVMIDMDGFKGINDNFGHQAGDDALVEAARIIRANLRKMDAAARYGGDEFILLLPRTDAVDAASVGRRIRNAYVQSMNERGYAQLQLGMSFGVATIGTNRPPTADALVAAADLAQYRAKRRGRDSIFISTNANPDKATG